MTPGNPDRTRIPVNLPRQQLFEQQVEHLMDRLYGTALRLTRNRDEAEDVVAEAVSQAWRRLDQLEDPTRVEGWLFRILHHTFISQWRRRRCRQDREVSLDTEETEDAGGFSLFEKLHQPFLLWWGAPERDFVNHLLQEDLQQAVDNLADPYRIVMVLVEIQGYTYDEAAHILDVPLGTVRSRLSRARSLLQKALWQQGCDAGLITRSTSASTGEGQ
ncbi:RNA polymerase sigma factor [Marinobacter sp.]|uniref:RNA polymerase sigma factor n=1 Tax=Marinobacter sp. TaxID=50741 RepID=UPI0035648BB5